MVLTNHPLRPLGRNPDRAALLAVALLALSGGVGCDRKAVETWLEPPAHEKRSSLYESALFPKAVKALVAKAGGQSIQALSLLVYEDHAVLQAQRLDKPWTVDQYVYRAGAVTGPEQVKLLGKGRLEDNLFPLDAVRLDVLPRLVEVARGKVDMPEGKVARVLLRRNLPESMDIQFRVFVSSQRRDAVVNADKDGNVTN